MISDVNCLGTTMVGSIVYLSLITFLSIFFVEHEILVLFSFHGFYFVDTKLILLLLLLQNI